MPPKDSNRLRACWDSLRHYLAAAFRAWVHRPSLKYREYIGVGPVNPGTENRLATWRRSESQQALRLIVIAAPSGAGKTTLCDLLRRDFPQIALSISTTTRAKRPYEQEGIHYYFVDEKVFEEKIARGDFAEWAIVHKHRYGTAKDTIARNFSLGKHILFDIDVQGALNLRNQYPDQTLLIFIHPPSIEDLKKRLLHRKGDSHASIETRLGNANSEVAASSHFDYQITNDDLTRAYGELKTIIEKECRLT